VSQNIHISATASTYIAYKPQLREESMLAKFIDYDKSFYLWCNQFQQNPEALTLFRFISKTGDGLMYAFLGVIALLFSPELGSLFLITGLTAYIIEIPSFIVLKKLIKRDRPFVHIAQAQKALQPADKFSLPSGHSAAAFLMASLIAVYYPLYADIALCWATLIALSRVLLGVHYLSDIIAGAVLGVSCTYLAIAIVSKLL
jgi:undecaprenyl-diphosphatase